METEHPAGADGVEVDQASMFTGGGPARHGGSWHLRAAGEEYSKPVLLRHLRDDHHEHDVDDRDPWPHLIELHDVVHGVQLALELG